MTISVAAFGGQYSFTPSSTNPLFAGGAPLDPASVSLSSFVSAGEAFQIEYLKAASSLLGATGNGADAYGLRFNEAGAQRTFILSSNADRVIAVDRLTTNSYAALSAQDRQAALSTGALSVTPFADDFAAQTSSFRTDYVQSNGSLIGSAAPQPRGLRLPEAGGDRVFILNSAGNDVIDVGRLDVKAYFNLSAADRTLARLSGGLALSPTAFELRTITPAQQADYLSTFGGTIATTSGGAAVQGVFLPDSGRQSAFILSASGTAIDIGGMSFSAFNALSAADRERVLTSGVLRIDPSASEFRAASAAEQKRFLDLFGVSLGKTLDGADVKGLLLRDSTGPKAFLTTANGVIDVATLSPSQSAFNSLPAATRTLIMATGTLPFLPSLELFQSWPSSSQLAFLTNNASALGTPPGGAASVSGLTLRGASGPQTYILSASGALIDPSSVTFSAFAATPPSPNALTDSERKAIVVYRGGFPTPTPAELKASDSTVQLSYLLFAKAQLGVTPGGAPIEGVRLSDGTSDGAFILSQDRARVIDVTTLSLADFLGLPAADRQLVNAMPEFQSALTSSAFRAATDAQRLAYLTEFGAALGTTSAGASVKGLRLADGAGTGTFILSSTGGSVIDVSRLSLSAFVALPAADRQLVAASSAFKPSLAEFLALNDLQKGAAIDSAGEDLGTVAPATTVKGLRFDDATGTRTFVRSADGLSIIEPNALSLDDYAALGSADRAIALAAGAFGDKLTAEAFLASSTSSQLRWLADRGQRLGALPDGTVVTGIVLPGASGDVAFVRNTAGTGVINVTALSPADFLLLAVTDRAIVAGSNLYRPALEAFNALSATLKSEFLRQASTATYKKADGSTAPYLTLAASDGDHRIILNSAGTNTIDTAALSFTSFYGLSAADQALVLASGGYAPNPTLAEFKAAAPSVQTAHINLMGYKAGSLADGAPVKAVVLSDGVSRSMFIVNNAGSNAIDALGVNAAGFAALPQADRDRVFATGQFTSLPTAAALRANPSLVLSNAVTLGYTAANVPVRGLVATDGAKQTLFLIDNANAVIEPGLMSTTQLDALTATQRDYIRSVAFYLPAGLIPPYFRDANERDPVTGELQRVRETKELYATTYLDGDTRKLPNNPLMGLDPTSPTFLNAFLQAHTAHQLEFIKANGNTITYTRGSPSVTYTTKALDLKAGNDTLTFVASTDGTSIINVAKLSIGAMSRLSQADQALVSKTTGYLEIAASLGLTADIGDGKARKELTDLVDQLIRNVKDYFPSTSTDKDILDAREIFGQELKLINDRLEATIVFSPSALQTKLSEITQRVMRVKAFTDVLTQVPDKASAFARGLDYDTLKEGLTSFVREEKRIAVNDTRIARLARLAQLGIPSVDLPSLIVEFQTLYEIDSRAKADADTVEVKQQNAMLSDYNEYQRVITLTAGSFPAKDDGKTAQAIKDETLDPRIKNMFDARWGTIKHPIETLTSTVRPAQYTAELTFTFARNSINNDGGVDPEEMGEDFLPQIQSVLGVVIPVAPSVGLPEYMWSLTAMDNYIRNSPDDKGLKDILDYLNIIKENGFDQQRAAFMKVLGVGGTFNQNNFRDLTARWEHEVGDYKNHDQTKNLFSTFFLKWLSDKDPDSKWTRTYFPQWVTDNYYKDNNDRGDKLNYQELTTETTRPLVYKALKRKVDWDNIGTQLSSAITNINQSNQIRQNSISQYQSEATRHFDLVNNTLKRMFDLMQSIGRNAA